MSMILQREGHVIHATLAGELTVADASQVCEELLAQLDDEMSLLVDARQVVRIDTSIAQVFWFASLRIRQFRVEQPSTAWTDTWRELGLTRPLPPRGQSE